MYRTWADFYQSDAQSVYALWIAPAFFLLYWLLSRPYKRVGVEPRAAWFLNVYAPLFTIESVADPYVTGPLLRHFGIEGDAATACKVAFVLIGDFRVADRLERIQNDFDQRQELGIVRSIVLLPLEHGIDLSFPKGQQ